MKLLDLPGPTTVHLVRHGQVENPKGVIYGRLPGFHLSERGRAQAQEASSHLADRDIGAVMASPLERAQETAAAIAEPHLLEVVTDLRLLESETSLQGVGRNFLSFLRAPLLWWRLRNPLRPSWGESYADIRIRMRAAIDDAIERAGGREVVLVSHQTPVREAVRSMMRRRRPTISGMSTPCHTGSVTTIELDENGMVVGTSYFRPAV